MALGALTAVAQLAACVSTQHLADGAPDGGAPPATAPDTGPPSQPQDSGLADGACALVNTQTDPSNCGTCGRSCLGGGCEAGACLPVTIASGLTSPADLAVDEAAVYFAENGQTLRRINTDGGGMKVLATEPSGLRGITVTDTEVYWTSEGDGGSVRRANKADGSGAQGLASNQGSLLLRTALDATHVYYSSRGAATIMRVARSGMVAPETLVSGDIGPTAVAVDGTYFYWTTVDTVGTAGKVSARRKDLAAGPVDVATGLSVPGAMVLDTNSVYWTDYKAGTIRGTGKPGIGGGIVTLGTNQSGPNALSIDATSVYWGTFVGESVFRIAKGAAAPQPVALAQTSVTAVANDDCCIYWTARGSGSSPDGRVVKLVK